MSIPFNFYLCNLDLGLWGNFVHTLLGNILFVQTIKRKTSQCIHQKGTASIQFIYFLSSQVGYTMNPVKNNKNMKEDIYGDIRTVSETQVCLCLTEKFDWYPVL